MVGMVQYINMEDKDIGNNYAEQYKKNIIVLDGACVNCI